MAITRIAPFSFALATLLLFRADAMLSAADTKAQQTEKEKSAIGELSEVELGEIRSARSLVGMVVENSTGLVLGSIEGVALNIGNGTVQGYSLRPKTRLPVQAVAESMIIPATTLKAKSGDAKVLVMEKLLESPPTADSAANSDDHVIFIGNQPPIEVRDKSGKVMGEIVDFIVAVERDRVGYAVFKSVDRKESNDKPKKSYYPIPLAAFVVDHDSKAWVLEIPPKLLDDTPVFEEGKYPTRIDGAWSEYVHVRYGRTLMGGVQEQTRAERAKESTPKSP